MARITETRNREQSRMVTVFYLIADFNYVQQMKFLNSISQISTLQQEVECYPSFDLLMSWAGSELIPWCSFLREEPT